MFNFNLIFGAKSKYITKRGFFTRKTLMPIRIKDIFGEIMSMFVRIRSTYKILWKVRIEH